MKNRVATKPAHLTVTAEFAGVAYEAIYHVASGSVQVRTGGELVGTCRWDGLLAGSAGDLPEDAYPIIEEALASVING